MSRVLILRASMSLAAACAALHLTSPTALAQVTIEWVTVGNPGNAADPATSLGAVDYEYRISAYEVTNAQYAAFLNAVAALDGIGLYNPAMGSSAQGGITRSGTVGSYTYTVKPNMGDKPVNFVSWLDAARFCNWMTNGQGGSGSTETGVYSNLINDFVFPNIDRDMSNLNQVFIPTEDEWYKAAYHQPSAERGDADDYWLYATQSNSVPTIATATPTGDVANPGQAVVNYAGAANWNGVQFGNVTTVGSAGSTSHYGAFDMNGNLWEWSETLFFVSAVSAYYRGGSFTFGRDENYLQSSNSLSRVAAGITGEGWDIGFRVASPVPMDACPGDTNGDNIVDFTDLNNILFNFGATGPDLLGDLNGDEIVNFTDLNEILFAFGTDCLN